MYGYIYKITNLINHKIYIGRHKAKTFDENYWGSGIYIKRAINAFGKENFTREVIAWAKNNDVLNKLEIKYIAEYKATDPNIGYNLTLGGDAIMAGRIKVVKGTEHKFIPESYLSLFLAAGWIRPDKVKQHQTRMKKYRQTHKAETKAAKKRYRQRHPEALARNNKTYYLKHKEQLKQYYKKYHKQHKADKEKNKEAQRRYMSNPANRAKHNALMRERRRREKEKLAEISQISFTCARADK